MHTDELGLIVQENGDGGDTAQRTGMYYFATACEPEFSIAVLLLEVAPGVFVRHPQQGGRLSDPAFFGRSQHDPLVIASGHCKRRDVVKRMLLAQLRRLGRYQDGALPGPSTIAVYVRSLGAWPLWPLLPLCDLSLLVTSLRIWLRGRGDPDVVAEDNAQVMALAQAQRSLPTPVSWLARKLYVRLRPWNWGCIYDGAELFIASHDQRAPVPGALHWYHRAELGGNPEIASAYDPIVQRF